MSQYKIAFFDIDGTLIDMQKKQITQRMLDTLARLKENNVLICIATGRSPITLPHFDGVEFDAFLTFNGSYCFNHEGTILSNAIPKDDVKKVIVNAAKINRPVSVATKDGLYANGKDKDLIDYYAFAKIPVNVADNFDDVVANNDIYQLMLGLYESEYASLLQDVTNAKIAAWWDRAVDVIPAHGGKGVAVRKILEYYNIDKSEAIAFGDGNNDIEMLKSVGLGVAMDNASEKLKEIAHDCCGHVQDDGIYHYCKKLELI